MAKGPTFKKLILGYDPIENVVKYVWSMQSVNPAMQNVGPVHRGMN